MGFFFDSIELVLCAVVLIFLLPMVFLLRIGLRDPRKDSSPESRLDDYSFRGEHVLQIAGTAAFVTAMVTSLN